MANVSKTAKNTQDVIKTTLHFSVVVLHSESRPFAFQSRIILNPNNNNVLTSEAKLCLSVLMQPNSGYLVIEG